MLRALAILAFLPLQDADKAHKLFDQAVALQEQEKYVEARDVFRLIAQKYPDTPAGKKAAKRGADNAFLGFRTLLRHGPSENRIDVVLTGDGYLIDKQKVLDSFAQAVVNCFRHENATFKEYVSYFNFHRMNASSKEAGVDTKAKKFDTVFGGTIESGMLHSDYPLVGQMMDEVFPDHDPFAIISIFSASGHSTGGGSMANIAGTGPGPVIHEFGHAFAGLLDEYPQGSATVGLNTAATNTPETLPWKHWLADPNVAAALGLGAYPSGSNKWIPTNGRCTMNSSGSPDFCPVCREAVMIALYSWVRPIDEATEEGTLRWNPKKPDGEIFVVPMKPATHELKVEWYLQPVETGKPIEPAGEVPFRTGTDRPKPSKMRANPPSALAIALDGKAVRGKKAGTRHVLKFADLALKPGTYAVIVRVVDEPVQIVKSKAGVLQVPWVLQDPRKLLEERRRWIVVVE
jgi:hypothetical protein